jgi:hypothetical protein
MPSPPTHRQLCDAACNRNHLPFCIYLDISARTSPLIILPSSFGLTCTLPAKDDLGAGMEGAQRIALVQRYPVSQRPILAIISVNQQEHVEKCWD